VNDQTQEKRRIGRPASEWPWRKLHRRMLVSDKLPLISDAEERLLWRLVLVADDSGLFPADPRTIRNQCLASVALEHADWTIAKVAACLDHLAAVGLIAFYEADGRRYLAIRGHEDLQHPDRSDHRHKQVHPSPPWRTDGVLEEFGAAAGAADEIAPAEAGRRIVSPKREITGDNVRKRALELEREKEKETDADAEPEPESEPEPYTDADADAETDRDPDTETEAETETHTAAPKSAAGVSVFPEKVLSAPMLQDALQHPDDYRPEQLAAALYEAWKAQINAHEGARAIRNIVALLTKEGQPFARLAAAFENYAASPRCRNAPPDKRKTAANFYGADATWRDYAERRPPPPTAQEQTDAVIRKIRELRGRIYDLSRGRLDVETAVGPELAPLFRKLVTTGTIQRWGNGTAAEKERHMPGDVAAVVAEMAASQPAPATAAARDGP